jgi:nucleoside-diphosphate-sugar epimerase
MEKVLVSGGAGFIGSHTVDLLLNKTSKVRHLAARDGDIRHSQANIMRMNQQLGVHAQTDIPEGLDELLNHSGDQG